MYSHRQLGLAAIGSMRPGNRRRHRRLLQEGEIEQRIDHHARAAGKNLAFLEAKILLVKIAVHFRLLGNKGDMSELAHGSPPVIC